MELYARWIAEKHKAELHIFGKGGHGFSMRKQNLPVDACTGRLIEWLVMYGRMEKNQEKK